MNLEALNKFVQNIDSFLSGRLLNIVKEKFSDDKIKGNYHVEHFAVKMINKYSLFSTSIARLFIK